MQNIGLIFLVFAFVLFCVATRVQTWNLIAVGLAFWVASELIGGVARSGLIH